jgi:hypothetical protein
MCHGTLTLRPFGELTAQGERWVVAKYGVVPDTGINISHTPDRFCQEIFDFVSGFGAELSVLPKTM